MLALWSIVIHASIAHAALHALRLGVYSVLALEVALLSGQLYDRFLRLR